MRLLRDPVLLAILAAGLAASAFANPYYLFLLTMASLTVLVGVGLNVLIGLTGQVSFGHVGFYAIGAYMTAVLSTKFGWDFWWTVPAAVLASTVVGTMLGAVALRMSGPYLAMVTIAFSFVVEFTVVEWESVTGGQNGVMNIPLPTIAGWALGERGIAGLSVLLVGAALVGYRRLAGSAWGLAMRAVRDSEVAAGSLAVNPLVVRTAAFAISAGLAGLAGTLFAPLTTFIAPSSFAFFQSILFVLVVIVGGAGRTYGPVIGAAVVVFLPETLSGLAEYKVLLFATLLLAVLLFAPGGIGGLLGKRFSRTPREAGSAPAQSAEGLLSEGAGREALEVQGASVAFGGVRAVTDV